MEEVGSKVEVRILELDEKPLLVILMVLITFGWGCRMGGFWLDILGKVSTLGFPIHQHQSCECIFHSSGSRLGLTFPGGSLLNTTVPRDMSARVTRERQKGWIKDKWTHAVLCNIHNPNQTPRITLLPISLDTTPSPQSNSLTQYQLG